MNQHQNALIKSTIPTYNPKTILFRRNGLIISDMSSYPVTNGVITFLPPPEGYVVDFDNPQQQDALKHFLIFGILGSLAILCLLQRLYVKYYITRGLKIDDGM